MKKSIKNKLIQKLKEEAQKYQEMAERLEAKTKKEQENATQKSE